MRASVGVRAWQCLRAGSSPTEAFEWGGAASVGSPFHTSSEGHFTPA